MWTAVTNPFHAGFRLSWGQEPEPVLQKERVRADGTFIGDTAGSGLRTA